MTNPELSQKIRQHVGLRVTVWTTPAKRIANIHTRQVGKSLLPAPPTTWTGRIVSWNYVRQHYEAGGQALCSHFRYLTLMLDERADGSSQPISISEATIVEIQHLPMGCATADWSNVHIHAGNLPQPVPMS